MMVSEDVPVRVPLSVADATEQALKSAGKCNWLVNWSAETAEYCGQDAPAGLCSQHSQWSLFTDGPDTDIGRT